MSSTRKTPKPYNTLKKNSFLNDKTKTATVQRPLKRKYSDDDTPAITAFFKPKEFKKRRVTIESISKEQNNAPVAPIAIPYRDDGEGRGALYDHRSIQTSTRNPTLILSRDEYNKHLKAKIESFQYTLSFGEQLDGTSHKYPPLINDFQNKFGLLILPGISQKEFNSPQYAERKAYFTEMIKDSRNKGRPILGICGGIWEIWEQFGGQIKPVTDHAYRGGMPRLSETTGKIGNNKQVHRIRISDGTSLIRAGLDLKSDENLLLPVNSVHSHAVSETLIPDGLIVTARTVQDDEIAPISSKSNNIEKEKMKPEMDSVEAFETAYGAPLIGVQWHPEAYSSRHSNEPYAKKHENLINYMVQAGQTYLHKQSMHSQLITNIDTIKSTLHKTKLLSYNYTVLRKVTDNHTRFDFFKLRKTRDLRHPGEVKQEIKAKEKYYKQSLAKLKQ